MSEKLWLVLSSETTGAKFPADTKAYASHHGAAFEQINEGGRFAFVELRETEMDRPEEGSLKQELWRLRKEVKDKTDVIRAALDVLERWNGYQDRIIDATKILRGKNPVQVTNKALFSIIEERPDPTLSWNNPVCPFCSSKDLEDRGGESTCLGWFPRVPEDDTTDCPGNPNLSDNHYICADCGKAFTYFVKYGNIWVEEGVPHLEPRNIVKGLPNTHLGKRANYTCTHCGEKAVAVEENERKYKHIIAPPEEENLPYKISCSSCGVSVESTFDCYQHPYTYKNAFSDVDGPIKFSVKPGVVIANSRAVQKGLPK